MKNYVQRTLIAHFFGFITLIITHILWSISIYGSASGGDTSVIIFWAGIFLTIFYLIFVLIPKRRIEKLCIESNLYTFSFCFAFYSLIGFIILIGWLFLNSAFIGVFLDAFVYGLTFGFTFYKLTVKNKIINFKSFAILFSIPILIFSIYIFVLPKLFPAFAFNLVPKDTQNEILKSTLPKFKKGDNFKDLQKALPGYFNNTNCNFSTSALMEDFQYSLVIKNCIISNIEYGPRINQNGITEMVVEESTVEK